MTRVVARAQLVGVLLAATCLFAAPARADLAPPQIHTVAGSGSCIMTVPNPNQTNPPTLPPIVLPCDGVKATAVPIGDASSVAALPGGGYLYVDSVYDLVRQVSSSGVVTTVAGNGTTTDAPDGTPAISSGLNGPVSVAPLPTGGFLITEYTGCVVRMVSPGPPGTATISTIAGAGVAVPANGCTPPPGAVQGPGPGAATSIALSYPSQAVPTPDGGVLIADTGNDYIRYLSPDGSTLSTVAGGGACNDATTSCEGMPAGAVALHDPVSVSPIENGSGYLIAEDDTGSANAVRQVSDISTSGAFTTVAGIPGQAGGYGGDGGPATSALLNAPEQVLSTSDGGFLIADTSNERIRQVSPSGTITTIAGNGVVSYAGDGGPATDASLEAPAGISPSTGGNTLIADANDGAIREITIPPVTTITLGSGAPNGTNGWYSASPLKVKVSAGPGTTTRCALDPTQPPPVFDAMPATGTCVAISGDGTHTLYAASTNSFGDKELPISMTFKIDSTRPIVKCTGKASFTFGARHRMVTATVADPGGSGPLSTVVSGSVDTSTLGRSELILIGYDNAGNATGAVCPYKVTPGTLNPIPVFIGAFSPRRASSAVKKLLVTQVPAHASVNVSCDGKGCPFSVKRKVTEAKTTKKGNPRTVDLLPLFARSRLTVGTRLTVSVTQYNTVGWVIVFTIRGGKDASHRLSCLAPGSSVPGKGCRTMLPAQSTSRTRSAARSRSAPERSA